ncbi:MAG TPA: MarR family transcriptional regulator [Vicinamibacterales bacterium]|nr:MarR family transcriptional regulator [Vicinamibacterales bacterium]
MKSAAETAVPTSDPYEMRPLGQALDFLRVLWAINHGLATTSRYMKSKHGVTGRQRLIIQVVNEFSGISAGDLAKVLHLDPSTLTGVLQQMSQRGLLLLQPDSRDRRRLRIQLTPKGRRMSHMAVGAIEAAVSRTLSHVSPAKLKATREVLSLLADNLDRHAEADPLADHATSA